EGSRLRPLTANTPKPLLPVVNRPIMQHVLRLLKRHGFTETVVTVQFLASLIRNYFGDGEDFGMSLQYATEESPLGTAGSVKNAAEALSDDTFLVVSGDALTDIDLGKLITYHAEHGALATVCLARVPNPLEFGITIVGEDGRIQRFLEKPSWGQVFSDTVNTGIYVLEPEILDHVAPGEVVDWSGDVFPKLLESGAPLYGYVADGYWEDVGTQDSYRKVHNDVLTGSTGIEIDGFELAPGIWVGDGAEVDPEAILKGPLYVGDYGKVEGGAELRDGTVLGSNVIVKEGAFLHRTVVQENAFIGGGTNLRGCVVGKNTDVMRGARIEEGAIIGDECHVEEDTYISSGVKVFPSKTIEAGAVVNTSVVWESRGHRSLFGSRGVSGLINVEITPELVVRLASAYASTLHKGDTVVIARDHSRAARTLKRAVSSALNAGGVDVRDLEMVPLPVAQFEIGSIDGAGGIVIRTSPGDAQSVDILFFDENGAELSPTAQRKLERVFSRQEFRRAFPGEMAELTYPPRTVERYVQELRSCVDTRGVAEAELKVVADCAGGVASLVLPKVLGSLNVDLLTVNNQLNEAVPVETLADRMRDLERLAALVSSSKADFGARFDPVGERISLVDERGSVVSDERALLVIMDLVADELRHGRIAVPVTATRVSQQLAGSRGVEVAWTPTGRSALSAAITDDVVLAADGRGGFVVPELHPAVDGIAAFVRLLGLVGRARQTLGEIEGRIPHGHVVRRSVPTPWASKGQVMRTALEAAGDRPVETTDGLRIVLGDDQWVLVLPDQSEPVTHIYAEGDDDDRVQDMLDDWADVVLSATPGA
ncbi:MAG: sugar phosphate nucleotidyltransferase, partial [Streptosporangiales bacterium]